jgi:Fic family protein
MLFQTPPLTLQEEDVIRRIDEVRNSLRYAVSSPKKWTGLLRRNTFARAIRASNSIEGYDVTIEDAVAAVEGEEPLEAGAEAWNAVVGYRNAMTYILQLSDDPHFRYDEALLRSLHYMMLSHDFTKNPGRWRPGSIYVRREPSGEIVYEGPGADDVPSLTSELVAALNATDPAIPVMIAAAMAHLNLVMIHPFSDGNGRMARALQTLVLVREGIINRDFCSIEEYLGRYTQDYYDILSRVGGGSWQPQNDARPWTQFCLRAHFRQATTLLRRSRELQRVWEEVERLIEKEGLPERAAIALVEAASGLRVRNPTYRAAAEVSENVASRDLKLLVDAKLLIAEGEKRGRQYVAAAKLRAIHERARLPRKDEDPFGPQAALPGFLRD